MIAIGNRVGRKKGFSWSSYWPTLISATVENAAPTNVVLTFPTAQTSLGATDFTIAGFTISSASWAGSVLTLVLSVSVVYGDSLTVTFVKTGQTKAVTNNVAAEGELTTYITGLVTPLSSAWKVKINNFIKAVKTGLSIADLNDAFDCLWILGGETQESSLRNLVENDHHCTLAGTPNPSFEALKGFTSNGSNGFIRTDYIPSSEGVNFTLNDGSFGLYSRTNEVASANKIAIGSRRLPDKLDYLWIRYTGDKISGVINSSTAVTNLTIANSYGMFSLHRTSATVSKSAKNSTFGAEVTSNVTFVSDYEFYILCFNNGGTAAFFDTKQISFAFIGKSLTQPQLESLVESFETCVGIERLTILGDSLSDGLSADWVANLDLTAYRLLNHAASGNTIMESMDGQVVASASDNADIIVIFLGTNDANTGDLAPLQAEAEENIAELKLSNPNATLYWVSPLPRWTDVGGGTEVQLNNIRTRIAAACASQGITYIDSYTVPWITVADTVDGVHTNAGGALKVYNEIMARI